ncbi:MAG: SpoIIE family protein phosphatase [Clostridiales bacterium]|nr:SpoIIE family protein phosphatase [Candidatus Crickella caballi]
MISGVMKIAVSGIMMVLLTAVLYRYEQNHQKLKNEKRMTWQIVIGIVYGFVAICGTEFGVQFEGAVMNIRDAAPLCAGLLFGAPAGIIAGLIGGIERWFAVFWGAGEYTRLACTLGTIIAGFFAAFIRNSVLENKRPGFVYAFALGMVTEVTHLLLVFLTNFDDTANAIRVVRVCTPVMIPGVAATVCLSALVLNLMNKDKFKFNPKNRKIVEDLQAGLLITVLITFVLTNGFVLLMQNHMAEKLASNTIARTLNDVKADSAESGYTGDELTNFLAEEVKNWHIGKEGYIAIFNGDGYIVTATEGAFSQEALEAHYDLTNLYAHKEYSVFKQQVSGPDDICYISYIKMGKYCVLGLYPESEADLSRNVSLYTTAFFEIIILAVLFIQIFFLIREKVVKSMRKVNDDLDRISSGDLDVRVNIDSNKEFVSLSEDINETVDTLKHYIQEASARIDAELQLAKDIQYSTLPRVYPNGRKMELYANMMAAKEVGGDFYDFYPVMGNKFAVLVADVSGKGIPAAMFMMKAKTLIKSLVETGASPETALTKANEELCENNDSGMFVTVWLGIIDLDTGLIQYANAGHNPPIIIRENKELDFSEQKPGFVLAGLEGIKYVGHEVTLEKGETIFMYTDGVTEATNSCNELYGEERLANALRKVAGMNTRYLCKYVKADVDRFVGAAPQFDDITMMAIRRKNELDGSLSVKPDKESIAEVMEYFDNFNEENKIPLSMSAKIMVIVDELYSNIVNYSGATFANIYCRLEQSKGRICMSFEDNGIAYNPLDKEDPDITLSSEEREIGGLGIFMVKEMAEDVKYSRINGNNILDVVLRNEG